MDPATGYGVYDGTYPTTGSEIFDGPDAPAVLVLDNSAAGLDPPGILQGDTWVDILDPEPR